MRSDALIVYRCSAILAFDRKNRESHNYNSDERKGCPERNVLDKHQDNEGSSNLHQQADRLS